MPKKQFTPPIPLAGLIGHRGVAAKAPENTFASFQLCAEEGIQWVEFDVRLTKDQELIIFHDDTLERTTNGQGWVHHHTLAELAELDAGSWFHQRFQKERIPHFSKILPDLLNLNLFLNIELKLASDQNDEDESVLATKLVESLQQFWPEQRPLPLVSSFFWGALEKVRKLNQSIPLGFLHDECNETLLKHVAAFPNAALHCNHQSISDHALALIQAQDIPVLAYTVNDAQVAEKLLKGGLFGIFSDDPKRLIKDEGVC